MKIVLRKKNSVTSIILFIYNIYGEIMDSYSIKLGHLVEIMSRFGKSETAIRMGLSRMVKAEILVNNPMDGDVYYELTDEGLYNIKAWNEGLSYFFKRYGKRHGAWNEKWYFLSIFNFNKSDGKNQFIVESLRDIGMEEVNSGLWISPFNNSKEMKYLFKDLQYEYMEIVGDVEASISVEKLLNQTYDIEGIREKYKVLIKYANAIKDSTKEIEKEENSFKPLFELGWRFYDVVTSDPVLPKALIDNWEGDEAVKVMNEIRSNMVKRISRYLKRIVKNENEEL